MNDYLAYEGLRAERDALCIEVERLISERDRQYKENVSQIMRYAALEAENARLRAALEKADGAIQSAAMVLGSSDEWTDQETMIADFEQRLAALSPPSASERPIGIGDDEGFIVGVNCGPDDDGPSASEPSLFVATGVRRVLAHWAKRQRERGAR